MKRSLETGNCQKLRSVGTPCPRSVTTTAMDQKQLFGGHGCPPYPARNLARKDALWQYLISSNVASPATAK